jgi:hypothetical protein
MCDLQPDRIADAVRTIFIDEGFNPVETPETSEQLRQLLLENGSRTEDDVDKILGCATIKMNGGFAKRSKGKKTRRSKAKRTRRRASRSRK